MREKVPTWYDRCLSEVLQKRCLCWAGIGRWRQLPAPEWFVARIGRPAWPPQRRLCPQHIGGFPISRDCPLLAQRRSTFAALPLRRATFAPVTLSATAVFKTIAIDHSAIPPAFASVHHRALVRGRRRESSVDNLRMADFLAKQHARAHSKKSGRTRLSLVRPSISSPAICSTRTDRTACRR